MLESRLHWFFLPRKSGQNGQVNGYRAVRETQAAATKKGGEGGIGTFPDEG